MKTHLPVVGSSAKTTAFCHARLEGPGGLVLHLDGNGKVTAGNGTLKDPKPNALSLPSAGISGMAHCPQSTETCRKACLISSHRVLTADLRYIPLRDLRVGDQLVSFDEEHEPRKESARRSGRQRYRTGTVKAVRFLPAEVFDVRLESGKVFTVTADHLWLSTLCCGGGNREWRRTDKLKPGVHGALRLMPEWEPATSFEAGWLAGLFDGEGCLSQTKGSGVRLMLSQKAGLVLERAKEAIEQVLGEGAHVARAQTRNVWQLDMIGGRRPILRALGMLRPSRLLAKFRPDMLGEVWTDQVDRVVSVTPAGVQEIASIDVDHATMVVEGYAHHNCYVENLKAAQPDLYALYEENAATLTTILADAELRDAWAQELATWIYEEAEGGFRWHVSGDVVSLTHAMWIADVCKRVQTMGPWIKLWIYTRSFDFLAPLVEVSTLNRGNLAVNLSADKDNLAEAVEASSHYGQLGQPLRICYLTVDGEVPSLRHDDVIFTDYNLRPRQFATLAESPWWQGLIAMERRLVCPVDAHGKSEALRCGPCSRCLK